MVDSHVYSWPAGTTPDGLPPEGQVCDCGMMHFRHADNATLVEHRIREKVTFTGGWHGLCSCCGRPLDDHDRDGNCP